MKHFKQIMMITAVTALLFVACNNGEEPINGSEGKAKIEQLAVSPSTNLKYGDAVTLIGILSDETGLRSYTVKISNASGDIYEQTQMLTGKTFNLNEALVIPLPPNAVAGNLTISLTVKNTGNQLTSQEIELKNVSLPNFPKLYLVLNGTAYEMVKNGDVFEFEDFVAAGATGKIYANADKTGIFWGSENGAVKVLGANDITFGLAVEEYFKISFNAVSFQLTKGNPQTWQPASGNDLYILGTISGHWQDGDISVEKTKMKMTEYSLGSRRMWEWAPPAIENTDDPELTCYGNTVAGIFRFKKGNQYVTYNGGQIVTGADNKDNSFVLSAPGQFHFRVLAEANSITSVRVFDEGQAKSLEYKNGEILLNGVLATPSISFAGQTMSLLTGNYFVYQSTTGIGLTKNAAVNASGIDLKNFYADPDVFTGSGNSTWQVKQDGSFYVRIDAFSGHVYLREESGYPNVIYLDGWCWKKYPTDPRNNWDVTTSTSLYRVGTSHVYEATIYVLPWGGDFKLFASPEQTQRMIKSKYFEGINPMDESGIKFPIPSDPGAYYKVSVDLKDGFTWNEEALDGDNYTLVPTNGKKFTITFTAI
ncbi:MAG: DUF4625 domain-containing protein [Dysgonamonadaceae bacterium]|jgi:hypothetical protein|nr:DUF4625 domain-containing protein [Dysgonamonadaceae bacterium]